MRPKLLYHGSVKKITGDKFIPRQAKDLGKVSENMYKAIYATNVKEIAIAMAIIKCKGVKGSSLGFEKKPYGTIYEGWPKQKYVYLYTFPSDRFKQIGGKGKQWASLESVKPIEVKRLAVSDYLHLVRNATKKEVLEWFREYRGKIRSRKGKRIK